MRIVILLLKGRINMKNIIDYLDDEPVVIEAPKKNTALKVFAVIGVIVAVAGVAYALYRYFKPDYLEDYEDDFEDFDEE